MAKRWWWPFGSDSEEDKAENRFLEMLQEATLVHDDLKRATEDMKAERMRRMGLVQARRAPVSERPRQKLQSHPVG